MISTESKYTGGYFIKRDEVSALNYENIDGLFVTNEIEQSIKSKILELIESSKYSIKLCSFIVSEPEIYSALMDKLKSSEIAIFLLTQLDENKLSASLFAEDLSENFNQKHIDYIGRLYESGAHVRAAKSAHAKFIISDNQDALIMSANITTPSLNTNPESAILVDDKEDLCNLVELFDIIYQYGTEFTKFKTASKSKQFIVSRDITIQNEWLSELSINNLKFTWAESNRSLYHSIIDKIINATTTNPLLISTYSVVGLGNIPELIEAIKEFIQKGGTIKLFCRGMNYRADHLKNCQVLAEIGVEIYGDLYNHSKGIVSSKSGIIFTANIDGNHGLLNGFEIGLELNNNQLNKLTKLIQWQIENAPLKFKLNPEKKEYVNTYNYYASMKGINPITLNTNTMFVVNSTDEEEELSRYPTYLFFDKFKNLKYISVNDSYYRVRLENNSVYLEQKVNRVLGMESYLHSLEEISITIKNNKS